MHVVHSPRAEPHAKPIRLIAGPLVGCRGRAQRWQACRLRLNATSQLAQMARASLCWRQQSRQVAGASHLISCTMLR